MEKSNLFIYIQESSRSSGIYYLNNDIPVWIEDPLPESVDLGKVLIKLENMLPKYYFRYIHAIRIGIFDEMIERQVNALYKDGVIYVSNMQDNSTDMLDDVIHEVAHAIEENNRDIVYGDEKILVEFLGKRKRLYSLLKNQGYDVILEEFLTVSYNYDFDMFLFQEIGYPTLNTLTTGLFPSAYSITSINEYFAVGFENYYMDETNYIKRICPRLAEKLDYLDEIANEY
tara:strand:+ start:566 stop:1252 length:687 start_codon:yes stop_codon:yes gene_type:complete